VPAGSGQFPGLLERIARGTLHAVLDVTGDDKSPRSVAQLSVNGDLDALKMNLQASATGDWQKPSAADLRVDGTIDAPQGAMLIKLMNLDGIVAAGPGPARLAVKLAGVPDNDMNFETQLTADGLSARANGKGQWSKDRDIRATVQI